MYVNVCVTGRETWGRIMGWTMAFTYMSARLVQLRKMILHPDTVRGIAPMMFVFAICGNATYLASILLRCAAGQAGRQLHLLFAATWCFGPPQTPAVGSLAPTCPSRSTTECSNTSTQKAQAALACMHAGIGTGNRLVDLLLVSLRPTQTSTSPADIPCRADAG